MVLTKRRRDPVRATLMIKLGICNELFEDWDFVRVCQFVKETGYDGLEIAPFTLAPLVTDLAPAKRRELRTIVHDAGLETIGLHWLLARTEGFCLTSPEPAVRRATGDYFVALAEAALDLGGSLLVLGSPKQRNLLQGVSYDQAVGYALDVFDRVMPRIGVMGIDLCLEPLAPSETDFINTCSQATEVIERVNHPHFKLHLDVKAQSSEAGASVAELTRRTPRSRVTSTPRTSISAVRAWAKWILDRSCKHWSTPATIAGSRSRCLTFRPGRRRQPHRESRV